MGMVRQKSMMGCRRGYASARGQDRLGLYSGRLLVYFFPDLRTKVSTAIGFGKAGTLEIVAGSQNSI